MHFACVSCQKLELALQGHQPKIDRVLDSGDGLIKAGHFATPDIKERQREVRAAWSELLKCAADRRKKMGGSTDKQGVSYLPQGNRG